MQVTIGYNRLGESGLIERPQFSGIEPRVFRIADSGNLEWMARQEWQESGWIRGRAYGHCLPASALEYV